MTPVYIAEQLGHADMALTYRVYQKAAKRRARLSGAHLREYDRALEWARMGTSGVWQGPQGASQHIQTPASQA